MLIARTVSSLLHVLRTAILSISSSIFTFYKAYFGFPRYLNNYLDSFAILVHESPTFLPNSYTLYSAFFSCNKSYDVKECEMGALISLTP